METTTQFPVVPGTVVEVKCSDSEAFNFGSNVVTCTIQTEFTYSEEPSCSTAGIDCKLKYAILLHTARQN